MENAFGSNLLGIVLVVIFIVATAGITIAGVLLYLTKKVWLSAIILWLAKVNICFDQLSEGFVARYESGGKFFALACSYGEFEPVDAPGDLNWAIRRIGESEMWPSAHTNRRGITFPAGMHTYTKEDFHWNRRLPFIQKLFGRETGIIWMGWWPAVRVRYYNLRLSNFRTVKPDDGEIKSKNATLRVYTAGGNTAQNNAGYLISWNEWSKHGLLSDDNHPIPVDGVRIGVVSKDQKKRQGVVANILVNIRMRIREPYLYFYRAEDAMETIDNEMVQHIRQLCASMTIEEVYSLPATLQSDKQDQNNPILSKNDFGAYMRQRYGVSIKGASFQYITLLGDAATALDAPYIAKQNADAAAIAGDGAGRAEENRLIRVAAGFAKSQQRIGGADTMRLRTLDAAQAFAESGKSNTVVLGWDPDNILGSATKVIAGAVLPTPPQTTPDPKKEAKK